WESQDLLGGVPLEEEILDSLQGVPVEWESQDLLGGVPLGEEIQDSLEGVPEEEIQDSLNDVPIVGKSQDLLEQLTAGEESDEVLKQLAVSEETPDLLKQVPVSEELQEDCLNPVAAPKEEPSKTFNSMSVKEKPLNNLECIKRMSSSDEESQDILQPGAVCEEHLDILKEVPARVEPPEAQNAVPVLEEPHNVTLKHASENEESSDISKEPEQVGIEPVEVLISLTAPSEESPVTLDQGNGSEEPMDISNLVTLSEVPQDILKEQPPVDILQQVPVTERSKDILEQLTVSGKLQEDMKQVEIQEYESQAILHPLTLSEDPQDILTQVPNGEDIRKALNQATDSKEPGVSQDILKQVPFSENSQEVLLNDETNSEGPLDIPTQVPMSMDSLDISHELTDSDVSQDSQVISKLLTVGEGLPQDLLQQLAMSEQSQENLDYQGTDTEEDLDISKQVTVSEESSEALEQLTAVEEPQDTLQQLTAGYQSPEIVEQLTAMEEPQDILQQLTAGDESPKILEQLTDEVESREILNQKAVPEETWDILKQRAVKDDSPEGLKQLAACDEPQDILLQGAAEDISPEILNPVVVAEKPQNTLQQLGSGDESPEILKANTFAEEFQNTLQKLGSGYESPETLKPVTVAKDPQDTLQKLLVSEESQYSLQQLIAELQHKISVLLLIQELEDYISADIKDETEVEYEIKGNPAAVNCLLRHLVTSGDDWQWKLSEALLSPTINLPDLAERLKHSLADQVPLSNNELNSDSSITSTNIINNTNNNSKLSHESLQEEVKSKWNSIEEAKWDSILPNLFIALKQLDQEFPDSWRLLAVHLGYTFDEVSDLENLGVETDSGSSLVNLIYDWLTHTKSDIDTLLVALGKMQNAQEVLNSAQVSGHQFYSDKPPVEGDAMEGFVGDGQTWKPTTTAANALSASKFVGPSPASLDADNNNDLQDLPNLANSHFGDANNLFQAETGAAAAATAANHNFNEPFKAEAGEASSVGASKQEGETKLKSEASLEIPAFKPVPQLLPSVDETRTDNNLVSPTLTPVTQASSVIEPMVTPDYSTSPTHLSDALSAASSSSSSLSSPSQSALQNAPEESVISASQTSVELAMSNPFYSKSSVEVPSSDVSSSLLDFPGLQRKSKSATDSDPYLKKLAPELNQDDSFNQNTVLESSQDMFEDSDKDYTDSLGGKFSNVFSDDSLSEKPKASESVFSKFVEKHSDLTPSSPEKSSESQHPATVASDMSLSDDTVAVAEEVTADNSVSEIKSHTSEDVAEEEVEDHSEETTSPKEDFQKEMTMKTGDMIPETVLTKDSQSQDSELKSNVEGNESNSGQIIILSPSKDSRISKNDAPKSPVLDPTLVSLEKSATEIVDSVIEAAQKEAVCVPAESETDVASDVAAVEDEKSSYTIDLAKHFTPQNIGCFVAIAALIGTTVIIVNKYRQ
ncbi:uncharacterized protein LOC115219348, partial [Argonauta hians]